MYHPYILCAPNYLQFDSLRCTKTLVPGGDNLVELKSKLPNMDTYPECNGFLREERNKFSVRVVCGMIQSQSLIGDLVSQLYKPDIKRFFNILIA